MIVATYKIKLGKEDLGLENVLLHNIFERKLIAIIRGIGSDRMLET